MKKKFVTIVCILLSIIALSFLEDTAYAADLKPSEGLEYWSYTTYEGENLYGVGRLGTCTDKCIVIGNKDNYGNPINALIGLSGANIENIEEIYIEDGITYISNYAFSGCTNLKKVRFPEGITYLPSRLFAFNSSIEEVVIPSSVKKIGDEMFISCSNLKSITIPEGVEEIGKSAFSSCKSLKSVSLPKSLKKIGTYAFSGCSSLTKINIPGKVTEISDNAFTNCAKIKSITIPKKVVRIGKYAFSYCTNLKTVKMYNKVKEIDEYAFSGCSRLKSIKLSTGLKKLGSYVFYGTKIKSLTVPAKVTTLGQYAFFNKGLNSIEFKGNKAKTIEFENRYYQCSVLFNDFAPVQIKFNGNEYAGVGDCTINSAMDYYLIGLVSYKSLTDDEKRLAKQVKSIAKNDMKIKASDSRYQKVKKVHDWLVLNTTYAANKMIALRNNDVNDLDIILNHHVAVCMDYALAFRSFMYYLKIPCYYITSDSMDHAWNLVKMDDDAWYHVDVTWDDPTNRPNEGDTRSYYGTKYLLRNGEKITDHYGYSSVYPKANGTKYEKEVDHSVMKQIIS